MKTSLKIILTILLVITAIVSLVSMLFTGSTILSGIIAIIFSLRGNWINTIIGILSGLASVGLGVALMVLFLIIIIACIVGIVYVFIGGSDKRIKELEAVINAAYSEEPASYGTAESYTAEVEDKDSEQTEPTPESK